MQKEEGRISNRSALRVSAKKKLVAEFGVSNISKATDRQLVALIRQHLVCEGATLLRVLENFVAGNYIAIEASSGPSKAGPRVLNRMNRPPLKTSPEILHNLGRIRAAQPPLRNTLPEAPAQAIYAQEPEA